MGKLILQPHPTFKGIVDIPCAGENPATVEFTFIHRTKSALDEFIKTRVGVEDVTSFMAMVSGWDLDEEWNANNVALLLENYIGAAQATFQAYVRLLVEGKTKNS